LPHAYWDWEDMIAANAGGYVPYTPATNLLQGLRLALDMLHAEGLDAVFARHVRAAAATRAAVRHWGFETQCRVESEHSASLTAVRLPDGHSADALRAEILERCNMSLGNGLGKLADQVFRIGHLGDFNDTSMLGVIAAVEMGLSAQGIPHTRGGVDAALRVLAGNTGPASRAAE
jgi:alanine-glyoxylate transaminase/serine-glyoxylate transaminase/serine-pyruvate transaminase